MSETAGMRLKQMSTKTMKWIFGYVIAVYVSCSAILDLQRRLVFPGYKFIIDDNRFADDFMK